MPNTFVLSNYNKEELLKIHLEILKYFDDEHEVIIVHQGETPLSISGYEIINLPSVGFRLGPLHALMIGIGAAHKKGAEKVCFRPGDDWVFNHAWVKANFGRLP